MIQMLIFLIVTEQLPRHQALEQSYSFEDQQFQNLLDWSRMLTLNISIFLFQIYISFIIILILNIIKQLSYSECE